MTTTELRYTRPWMYAKQEAAIFNDARISVIEASTKSGKTVGCMVWLAEQAMQSGPGRHHWWVAPVVAQAKIAFRRLKRGLPSGLYTANETERTITLANGATIWFKSADNPDTLYGEDVDSAVIDEATRCKEEAWHAVRSTLTATRGPVRIIGNVKGRKNWMYRLARRAQSGEPGMEYHKITAFDAVEAGVLDAQEIEQARRDLPDNVFRELYLAEPSDDGGNPFGLSAIAACVAPLSTWSPICWGWDLAKSVDWTVGIALDERGHVCRFERFQSPWQETARRILEVTDAPALVDSTGVGDPIVEGLQRARPGLFEGFHFNATSKQQLMEGLAVAIQHGHIRFPDGVIRDELDEFEYAYTRTGVRYTAPEGLHDDCVMALALAWRNATMPMPVEGIIEFDTESVAISPY